MKKYLRIIVILILFLSFFKSFSSPDSLYISICEENSSFCLGYAYYSKTVEHFDSVGNKTEINNYYFSGCERTLDSILAHVADTYYSYDSNNLFIEISTLNYQGPDTNEAKSIYTHNSSGKITSTLNQLGTPGNLINSSFDSIGFDSSENKIFEMFFLWNDTTSSWDTLNSEYNTYDSLNRKIQTDLYNIHQNYEIHHYNIYDNDSNLIYQVNSSLSFGVFDSNRVVNLYDSLHHKIELFTQQWDTLQQVWININHQTFNYNSAGLLFTTYFYSCDFDSLCNVIESKSLYTYDSLGRLMERNDSIYEGTRYIWGGYTYTYRNSDDLIFSEGYWEVVEQGCDYSDHFYYTYNNQKQLIYMHRERYTCDAYFTDCYYFSLDNDSMLVRAYYPFNVCQGDTIYPIITVEGGQPPYNYQWFPSVDILDASTGVPRIVADTTKLYLFKVTDSAGLTQIDSLTLHVPCLTTRVDELNSSEYNFNLFPNPFSFETTIKFDERFSEVTCVIYDIKGQVVRTNITHGGTIIIKRENLFPGIYFISLFASDKFIGNRKLIVE